MKCCFVHVHQFSKRSETFDISCCLKVCVLCWFSHSKLLEHIVEKGKCGLEENFTALWYSMLCCISIRQLHSSENVMFVCAGEVCHSRQNRDRNGNCL